MSSVFDKFATEINFKKTDVFNNLDVVKAKIQSDGTFKLIFKNDEIIPFDEMLKFIVAINNNFRYKADLKFEITSVVYDETEVTKYISWIIKKYLNQPYLSNSFVNSNKSISKNGLLSIKVYEQGLKERIERIKPDLERIMKKFGFEKLSIKIDVTKGEDILKIEENLVLEEARKSFSKNNKQKLESVQFKKSFSNYEFVEIHEINHSGLVKIETKGIIFKKDSIKTKTGTVIIKMGLTNNIDAIEIKLFATNDKKLETMDKFDIGDTVEIRGNYQLDAYNNLPTINVNTIREAPYIVEERTDNEKGIKRVELAARTRMSTMDGVTSAKDLVNKAIKWGHDAIAIVDESSVQSFPEFYNATKNKNVKPIYGASINVINRENNAIYNNNAKEIANDTYVIFDLETTGLSPKNNDIIEFGAVKFENGNIVDKQQFFIKPSHKIPKIIQDITNITDEMVDDAISEKEGLKKILEYVGDHTLVAHNAGFDFNFINEKMFKYNLGEFKNPTIDTLVIAKMTHPEAKKFRLETVAKRYNVYYDSTIAHRADYDADVLAKIWQRMIGDLEKLNLHTQLDISEYTSESLYKKTFGNEVTILAKNQNGLKDLFKLISLASSEQLFKKPTLFWDQLVNKKDLLIGSSSLRGRLNELMLNGSSAQIKEEIKKYDYIEILAIDNYKHLFRDYQEDNIKRDIKWIIDESIKQNKIVVATGDVRYIDPEDKIYHEVYINAKGLGGSFHYLKKFRDKNPIYPDQHLRTTDEMRKQFYWLEDTQLINDLVVKNSQLITDMIDSDIKVIKDKLYTPIWSDAADNLEKYVYNNAKMKYGDTLPKEVVERIEREIKPIRKHGFSVIYWISHLLVNKSLKDGYLVGSRGSVGSSLVATLSNITEVNPLDPHYLCSNCKYSEFHPNSKLNSGYDLPDKNCPKCDRELGKEGQKIPFETFLGFDADKVPDIDLNFSGVYQPTIHKEVKKIFGEKNAFRAGTISTVAERTAFGYVKSWVEDNNKNVSKGFIEFLAKKVAGTKRTTGQHPGGIIVIPKDMEVEDFTPVNYPANDKTSEWKTTHFDFHAIHDNVLKLDLLGHDDPTAIKYLEKLTGVDVKKEIPFFDPKIISLFSSTKELGITPDDIDGETTGAMGIPEFGTSFVRRMLRSATVTNFGDLIALSGLSHGTDVWSGNAEVIIKERGKTLSEVISCRDNIMTDLMSQGIEPIKSFEIMERVRKGKSLTIEEEELLLKNGISDWYIDSLKKIKYMFPKAHATAYVMMAWRIAWFKLYHAKAYYATYFTTRSDVFDIETILLGRETILEKLRNFKRRKGKRGEEALTNKEVDLIPIYELALEAMARGIKIKNIDMQKSMANEWIIDDDGELIPPFTSLDGLGISAAESIIKARKEMEFGSIDDIKKRTSINKTNMEKLRNLGVLKQYSQSNQLELDLF